MKKNNLSKIRSISEQLTITIIFLFTLIIWGFRFNWQIPDILYNSDSVTYFYPEYINKYRTPFYNVLIKFILYLFPNNFTNVLIGIQVLFFFFSAIIFYKITKNIFNHQIIKILATVYYLNDPQINKWCFNINPEIFTIVFILSYVYFYLFLTQKHNFSLKVNIISGVFSFVGIMIKPVFIVLVPCLIVFVFLFNFYHRNIFKKYIIQLLNPLTTIILLLVYSYINFIVNQEFVISKIALNNSIGNVIHSKCYKFGENEKLITFINKFSSNSYYDIVFALNYESVENYNNSNKIFKKLNLINSPDMFYCENFSLNYPISKAKLEAFLHHSKVNIHYLKYIITKIINFIINNDMLFSCILLLSIYVTSMYSKKNSFECVEIFIILLCISLSLVIIIGGIEDLKRLFVPAYSLKILIYFKTISLFFEVFKFNSFKSHKI